MKNYVLGFMFNDDRDLVALIEKQHPAWQQGLYNGIGGKLEKPETWHAAMVREFEEETGVRFEDWECFGSMGNDKTWECYLFTAANTDALNAIRQTTDEKPLVVWVQEVCTLPAIHNIPALVQLARIAPTFNDLTLMYKAGKGDGE